MLEAQNLVKRYRGIPVVDDLSFTVRPGEILGLLGPNGAGKSTTIKMIVGLTEPSEGGLLFRGRNVFENRRAFERCLGYVPDEPHLYMHLSGREYLQLLAGLRGMARQTSDRRIEGLLRLLNLTEDAGGLILHYSKGMRQKVLLAAALLHDPEVLVLDEPFSGLDVEAGLVLRGILRGLAARGRTILYSSHVLDTVERVANTILVLQRGRVVAHDSLANLRDMTQVTSLEGIFATLTESTGADETANEILEVIRR